MASSGRAIGEVLQHTTQGEVTGTLAARSRAQIARKPERMPRPRVVEGEQASVLVPPGPIRSKPTYWTRNSDLPLR